MKKSIKSIYIPITLFIIAFFSKFIFISSRDICIDEPFTLFNAQYPIIDILRLPAQNEPNPPLFMLLLHCWIKIAGISPLSVRFLPLLFNALTVVFIYLIGKRFFSFWTGIVASCIFILSTYHFYFGLETRTYSLLSFSTSAALYYFLSLITDARKKYIIGLIFTNLLLIYSHYFGWFIVFVEFISCFLFLRNRKLLISMVYVFIATGILFLPMVSIVFKQFLHSSQGTWVQPPSKADYFIQLFYFFNTKPVFITCLIVTLLIVGYLLFFKKYNLINKKVILILVWWAIPYTIMFLLSFKIPMFINRYILFNTIGIYLFIAVIINLIPSRKISYLIGLIYILLFYNSLEINSKDFYYREVKKLVENVKQETTPKSVLFIYPHWADLGIMYYYNRKVFENYSNFDSLLSVHKVYRFWNSKEMAETLKTIHEQRIIYIQDGQLEDNSFNNLLDSTYSLTKKMFYPQCFQLRIYDNKKEVLPN